VDLFILQVVVEEVLIVVLEVLAVLVEVVLVVDLQVDQV
jgi:hypothetical protein